MAHWRQNRSHDTRHNRPLPANECILCGAPGGYPYCNTDCREADNPEGEEPTTRPVVGTDDPWASDARNHL